MFKTTFTILAVSLSFCSYALAQQVDKNQLESFDEKKDTESIKDLQNLLDDSTFQQTSISGYQISQHTIRIYNTDSSTSVDMPNMEIEPNTNYTIRKKKIDTEMRMLLLSPDAPQAKKNPN